MTRQQQRFEGPELEPLLERIRAELGEAANIIAANRVRRGGVGGFFAREHFEVIVEPGAPLEPSGATDLPAPAASVPAASGASVPAASGATSILELAEAVNGTERARQTKGTRQTKRGNRPPAPAGPTGDADRSDAVVDLTETEPGRETDPATSDGERFVQILDRIAREVDADGGRGHDRQRTTTLETRPPDTRPPDDDIAIVAAADRGPTATVTPFAAPRVRRTRDVEIIERPENLLARLGLPPRYIPRGVADPRLRGALIESLAQLPVAAPLPDANGVVVAVVGIGAQPVLLARALATERGLDPDNLVLATARELGSGIPSWLQITDAATAEERRRSWRRRSHATFVAVSVPSISDGHAWAKAMLDHLEPTQTWGIVDATWKVEDTEAWADHLGGLDVVAVEHLAATASPASPIQLEIPIGRLDGRPATPLRWAEILTERLVDR